VDLWRAELGWYPLPRNRAPTETAIKNRRKAHKLVRGNPSEHSALLAAFDELAMRMFLSVCI